MLCSRAHNFEQHWLFWLAQGDSDVEFDDGYGSDLMGDEEDRAKLMAMTELEREMILAERAEKRDEERERMKLLKRRQQQAAQKASPHTSFLPVLLLFMSCID